MATPNLRSLSKSMRKALAEKKAKVRTFIGLLLSNDEKQIEVTERRESKDPRHT